MSTYTLSGSGTQALTAGVVALHVTITTLPASSGNGGASPLDYYGVGVLRPGNAAAFWEPFTICGGPQWMPVPFATTRLGYALHENAVVSVVEVYSPAPLVFPLALLPDVAIASPADTQVLTYQSSSAKWINAAASGGGGGGAGPWQSQVVTTPVASVTFSSIPATRYVLRLVWTGRSTQSAANVEVYARANGDTGNNYTRSHIFQQGGTMTGSVTVLANVLMVGECPAASAAAGMAGAGEAVFPDYANSVFWKTMVMHCWTTNNSVYYQLISGNYWKNTAPITSLTIFPAAGNWATGSAFHLF